MGVEGQMTIFSKYYIYDTHLKSFLDSNHNSVGLRDAAAMNGHIAAGQLYELRQRANNWRDPLDMSTTAGRFIAVQVSDLMNAIQGGR